MAAKAMRGLNQGMVREAGMRAPKNEGRVLFRWHGQQVVASQPGSQEAASQKVARLNLSQLRGSQGPQEVRWWPASQPAKRLPGGGQEVVR